LQNPGRTVGVSAPPLPEARQTAPPIDFRETVK
jgi:hypothetical protein